MSSASLKSAVTGERQQRTIYDYLEDPRVRSGIAAVAGKYLTSDRMLRLCVNAIKKTPRLLECDPKSVLGAVMMSAALGLEPNTIQQQAFLIPYKRRVKIDDVWTTITECQFQVGARGFITLAFRSPHVKSIVAEAIHEGDMFEHELGSKTFLRYAKTLRDRGPLIGSFSHVVMTEGGETACVLPLSEVYKIRERSETFKAVRRDVQNASSDKEKSRAEEAYAETPWVMWEDDMAIKSAIKKHAKQLPISSGDTLITAAELDNHSDLASKSLDLRALIDPDVVRSAMSDGALPALENDPAPTVDLKPEEREREKVVVAARRPQAKRQETASAVADKATGELQAYQVAALDIERLEGCNDSDELALMIDEMCSRWEDGPEKAAIVAAYRTRAQALTQEG